MTPTAPATTSSGSAIVVLGMARSGTSAVTRLLALLGVSLGPEQALLPPAGENARGFFEHRPIMQINKELLERLGGSWSAPPLFARGWERDSQLDDLRARARALLAADFAGATRWGFKDPRTSLTLPFWDELLQERVGERIGYVICHRRPLDSASSLQKRDGIRLDDGVALWTRYMASALANTAGRRRLIVGYERLFSEREAVVGELASFLGMGEGGVGTGEVGMGEAGVGGTGEAGVGTEVRAQVREWIEEDLRHHSATLREQVEHPAVSAQAQALNLLFELAIANASGALDALDGMAATLLRAQAARATLTRRGIPAPSHEPPAAAAAPPEPSPNQSPVADAPVADTAVSIVLVLGDDPWGAMDCLESIGNLQRDSPSHEVVLVDNASLGLATTLAALEGDVRLVRLPERLPLAMALYEGAQVAQGEILICLPAPALLAENVLGRLLAPLLGDEPPIAVASVDPATLKQAGATAEPIPPHPATALALALRRDSLTEALSPVLDVADERLIGALCFELAAAGAIEVATAAHVTPTPPSLLRRGPGVEPIELSVIVPTLDATALAVRECLRALQATITVPHEIIVVDNGAPPQGFTAPVNAALRAARGRHLAIVNDDVRVLDGWWEPLAGALDEGAQLVFPLTIAGRMRWDFAAWCFAMRRELLDTMAVSAGEFFDPTMLVWCQDADLRKRMAGMGLKPLCVPESHIRHTGSRTVRVGAPHTTLRNWIHAQAARDTAIFRDLHPDERIHAERDALPPGLPTLTPEHAPRSLSENTLTFHADGPAWQGHTLPWPAGLGHFFLAGDIHVQAGAPVQDILLRAILHDEQQRELFWIDLVPGVIRTGRASFAVPRERARAIARDGSPPEFSQVRTIHLAARSRLRGALQRAPGAAGATTATIENLRVLALPAAPMEGGATGAGLRAVGRESRHVAADAHGGSGQDGDPNSRLGIAVITYQRRDRFEPLMERLARFTETPHELVVAEDGGDDGTVQWCRERGIRVVTGENHGVARNKNRALFALASLGCDPILIVEDDVYPDVPGWERDWIDATRRWHHLAYLHPRIAQFTVAGSGTPDDPFVNPKASAALLTISARALADVGYLDSRFIGWGHAHGEWTTRIKRAGYGFKPIVLPDGTKPKAQLYLVGGLVDNEGERWRDEESGKRNRALYKQIYPEPVFRLPWRSAQERAAFLAEQAQAGIEGESLADALDAVVAAPVG